MRQYIKLGLWIIGFQLVGLLLGMITREHIPFWYNQLIKPQFTPPSLIFALVWPMLYLLLAVVGWRLYYQHKSQPNSMSSLSYQLFVLQQLFNWLWTLLFFQWHLLGFSLVWLILLTLLNIVLIYRLFSTQRVLALLLMPYVAWLIFATYLNGAIYYLN